MSVNKTYIRPARRKKLVAIVIACIAAALVAAVILSLLFVKARPSRVVYCDGEVLKFCDIDNEPQVLHDSFDFDTYKHNIKVAAVSEDGKKLFYYIGKALYLCNTENSVLDKAEIVSDCSQFYLHKSGEKGLIITYGDARSLSYWCESDGIKKLSDNLDEVKISKDFEKIFYTAYAEPENYTSQNLYLSENGNEAELIEESIGDWQITESGKTLYFVKDGNLYSKNNADAPVCLSRGDDGITILNVFDGGVYYKIYSPLENDSNRPVRLAFHDGKKEYILNENYCNVTAAAKDRPVIFYYATEEPVVDSSVDYNPKFYVAVDAAVTEIEGDVINSAIITPDGK